MKHLLASLLFLLIWAPVANADNVAPWGRSVAASPDYKPQKVVYDVAVADVRTFERVLDRASFLNNLYNADPFNASIILVLHGDEINFFATKNYPNHKELMRRAQSLTVAGTIKFRMCTVAAKMHGYDPKDIHGFVEMVPMADAEIIRLQTEDGYAYMQ